MVLRQPRGFSRNIPYYREISEGTRPATSDVPVVAYTGLPHVRVDDVHHDPIVLDPGTLVGLSTGYIQAGVLFPCTMQTGTALTPTGLQIIGSTEGSTYWGLPDSTTAQLSCGTIKPIGAVFQPIYSFILNTRYTNYKRNDNVGVLTRYLISIPATNSEEVLINSGDVVMVGTGTAYGIGVTSANAYNTTKLAGRYAVYDSTAYKAIDRIVGRCFRKLTLGTGGTSNETLESAISAGRFVISSAAQSEFSNLAKVQTVPGLGLSGSGTSGIPAYLLGAKCDGSGTFYALTILLNV